MADREIYAYRWILAVALLITVATYANSLSGEFVYDDHVQIVENPTIQENALFWKALGSDVWAFKGGEEVASNYWRPVFVAWLVLNHRLFGLDPFGWHVTNVLLQCVVLVFAARVLRGLGTKPSLGAVVLWVFAAHPVHTESVAWVSGSPDLLVSIFLLSSFDVYLASRGSPFGWRRSLAWLLYAGATLSKEISVLFPAVVFVSEWALSENAEPRARLKRAVLAALPYVVVAVLYLGARQGVLGMTARSSPWAPGLSTTALSLPSLLA